MERRDVLKKAGATAAGLTAAGLSGASKTASADRSNENYGDINLWGLDFDLIYDEDVSRRFEGMEFQEYPDTNDEPDVDIIVQASEIYDKFGFDQDDEDYWALAAYGTAYDEVERLSDVGGRLVGDVAEVTRYLNGVLDQDINSVNLEIQGKHSSALSTVITEENYQKIRRGEVDTDTFYENNTAISTMTEQIENQVLIDQISEPVPYNVDGEEVQVKLKGVEGMEGVFTLDKRTLSAREGEEIVEGLDVVDVNPSSVDVPHVRLESDQFENEFADYV